MALQFLVRSGVFETGVRIVAFSDLEIMKAVSFQSVLLLLVLTNLVAVNSGMELSERHVKYIQSLIQMFVESKGKM